MVRSTSTATIHDGNWHHVSVTTSASGTALFIDGVELTGGAVSYSSGSAATTEFFDDITGASAITVGAYSSGGIGGEFDGLLDDVRIDGHGLSTTDVANLSAQNYAGSTITVTNASDRANGDTLSIATLLADDGGDRDSS